jgi:hypothetical protein
MTDAAYLELLASYEAAIEAASFALKTATALAEANQRGERLSESEYQQMLGRLIRRETEIEMLRENVQRFKAGSGRTEAAPEVHRNEKRPEVLAESPSSVLGIVRAGYDEIRGEDGFERLSRHGQAARRGWGRAMTALKTRAPWREKPAVARSASSR